MLNFMSVCVCVCLRRSSEKQEWCVECFQPGRKTDGEEPECNRTFAPGHSHNAVSSAFVRVSVRAVTRCVSFHAVSVSVAQPTDRAAHLDRP